MPCLYRLFIKISLEIYMVLLKILTLKIAHGNIYHRKLALSVLEC